MLWCSSVALLVGGSAKPPHYHNLCCSATIQRCNGISPLLGGSAKPPHYPLREKFHNGLEANPFPSSRLSPKCRRRESNPHTLSDTGFYLPLQLSLPLSSLWSGLSLRHSLSTLGGSIIVSAPRDFSLWLRVAILQGSLNLAPTLIMFPL